MKTYRNWSPTSFDTSGLNLDDRQDWLVAPCGTNRDADVLTESNYHTQLTRFGDGNDHEVHRFHHWACGWFEIVLVRPGSDAHWIADALEARLTDYPILDENDHSEREYEAACETWKHCYTDRSRLAYIRRNYGSFSLHNFRDLLGCVRGRYFAGDASDMVGP